MNDTATPGQELLQILAERGRWTSAAVLLRKSRQFEFQDDLERCLQQMVAGGHVIQTRYPGGSTVVYRVATDDDRLSAREAASTQLLNNLQALLNRARAA